MEENIKMSADEMLMNEEALLRGLMEVASDKDEEIQTIEVIRKGQLKFAFRIRPLTEKEYQECKNKSTTYFKNNKLGGIRLPDETDSSKYRSLLIYKATVEDDCKRLWENKDAWKLKNVINAYDFIDAVIKAGEKEKIIDILDTISGYESEISKEELAKD